MTTTTEMIAAVKQHARDNYERDGWDYVVECWENADIEKAISGATTTAAAIQRVRKIVTALNDRRKDIEGEIF